MYKVYDKWPELSKEFYDVSYDQIDFKGIDYVVFVGMGGSGIIGDTISSILSKTRMHVLVTKGYHIPKNLDSHTLVVATSASGNTKETLTIMEKVKKTNCKLVGFSSGGKMEQFCKKIKSSTGKSHN